MESSPLLENVESEVSEVCEVADFLRAKGFEAFIPNFLAHEIEPEDLPGFTWETAQELIPKAGPRMRFLKAIKTLKVVNQENVLTVVAGGNAISPSCRLETSNKTPSQSPFKSPRRSPRNIERTPLGPHNLGVGPSGKRTLHARKRKLSFSNSPSPKSSPTLPSPNTPATNSPSTSTSNNTPSPKTSPTLGTGKFSLNVQGPAFVRHYSISFASNDEINELQQYVSNALSNCLDGHYAANAFTNNRVDDSVRKVLCELILTKEINKSADRRITPSRFRWIALAISAIYPEESPFTYYIPQQVLANGKKAVPKGLLYEKFKYKYNKYKEGGLIEKKNKEKLSNPLDPKAPENETSDEQLERLHRVAEADKWIRKESSPHDILNANWKITSEERRKFLHNDSDDNKIEQYIALYPALRKPFALTLIDIDFEIAYPDKINSLCYSWPTIKENIIKLVGDRCKKEGPFRAYITCEFPQFRMVDSLSEDEKSFLALGLLTSLVKPSGKKYSRKDVKDDFILYVPSQNEKKVEIKRRNDRLKASKLRSQPIPIVVGIEPENFECTVEFNNFLFNVESPLAAVNCCFKLCMVLNAEFSAVSYPVWLLIQQHFFRIRTRFDVIVPGLETLAVDLGLPKLQPPS